MSENLLQKYKNETDELREWLIKDSNLPKTIKPILLLRFLKVCNFDQDKARQLITLNYEFRTKYPQIFANRDFNSEEIQKVIRTVQIFPLPKTTRENHRITMSRWIDHDAANFDVTNTLKWLFMISDMAFIDSDQIADGEIAVMDFKGFSWSHFFKVAGSLTAIRGFLKYVQEAVPYRIAQNHYVNCSPILSKLILLLKPFIATELFEVMHFHSAGYETLYENIPKDILPQEYGGNGGSIEELYGKCLEMTRKHCDYVKDENNFKIKE